MILLLGSGEYATVAGHYLGQFDGVVVADRIRTLPLMDAQSDDEILDP
jgi:hypothetical protein